VAFSKIGVIHTVSSLKKSAGGPTRTVTALCGELAKLGAQVELLSQDYPGSPADENVLPPADQVSSYLVPAYRLPIFSFLFSPSFRSLLRQRCQPAQGVVIHNHGLWLPTNHAAAAVARQIDIPLILSARGMLEPWALNYRAWKKQWAWRLYQRRDLQTARVLHATAEREAENLRRLGLRQPIAVIPNGVDFPEYRPMLHPAPAPRIMLFLGRIHPVKGLLELVNAWRIARSVGWKVLIAGPDEGGYRGIVEDAVSQAGLKNDFAFVGAVDGKDKVALYQQADLFVLPSFTENFGVVVAEALACGVPVITTRGTPWEGLLTHRCGWWIDLGVEPLAAAIREATALSDEQRREIGRRGRQYVEREFGWPDIAQQMLSVYHWMLRQGDKPDCVITD
jgi:glycosyltransferase involved in cell wall biosynthesis